MKLVIIDGQGGRLGSLLVEAIRKELPELKAALNAIIAERQGRTR